MSSETLTASNGIQAQEAEEAEKVPPTGKKEVAGIFGKDRKAKAGTRLGSHQGQPVRASETAAAAVERHLSETADSGRAGGTVRCTGMCPRLRSSQCGSVHRCGAAGQCHAGTGAADTGTVCVRAGVLPLGRPRKAAPLFSGSSGGTVQLCRRLCDAEKPAGN